MLVRHPMTGRPETKALLALMLFHTARTEARLDAEGGIILLADQDRSRWDLKLIGLAEHYLREAAKGDDVSTYHMEAAIAGIHAHAPSFNETDWNTIIHLYDRLLALAPNAIVRFNRAIAVGQAQGCAAGLKALDAVEGLERSHLYHAARGDLLRDDARSSEAHDAYAKAVLLARSAAERALLNRKIEELGQARS
jgi:RNA polymerase sigma-70 factor (ECF subfamily)